jgi:hypothetical protein
LEPAFAQEHATLLASATAVITDLEDFRRRLRHRHSSHRQHFDFAERALSLRMYLGSALDLAARNEYLAAFSVLRSSLEHHLTDRLLFLARRYKLVLRNVEQAVYEQLVRDWKARKAGTEDIVKVERKRGKVAIIRTGLHPTGGRKGLSGRTLSIYYFHLQNYDPFVGPPEDQRYLAREFTSIEQHTKHAQEQQRLYGESMSWRGIKSNLIYSRLCTAELLRRFDVHYRFLSAYVHPALAGFTLVYGHNRPSGAPRYDHYASELVLLYINKIASEELKALKRMAGRRPKVELMDWSKVEAHVRTADAVAAHLWFPGDRPGRYDYVEEANSRGLRGDKLVAANRRPTPAQLKVTQVRYYRNPLRHLIGMHRTVRELMGFTYVSSWPRQDAQFK